MSLVEFRIIRNFHFGSQPDAEELQQLLKEATLMALARATSADMNIEKVEIKTVQAILLRVTGEEVSTADIRTAAKSEIFEKKPLEKYLNDVGRRIDSAGRITIIQALAEVIKSDERVSDWETNYFDMVANALHASPSEIIGLKTT